MLTSSYDRTCDYLISKFNKVAFFRFNVDQFSSYRITYNKNGFKINHLSGEIDSDTCQSIYIRKPSMEALDGIFDSRYHNYIHRESYSLIEGLSESFEGMVLTKLSVMRKANNKVFQALLASRSGFIIPDYAITNDEDLLNQYSIQKGIIKPLSLGEIEKGNTKEFVQTNLIREDIDVKNFEYSPVYLQSFIDKDFEIRVTVIDGVFFPVRIDSINLIDWRKPNNKVSYKICEIPEDIKTKCLKYMSLCEMKFGCFDFLIKDGIWYFLEMNANGQWAWLEMETKLKISDEIINLLKKG